MELGCKLAMAWQPSQECIKERMYLIYDKKKRYKIHASFFIFISLGYWKDLQYAQFWTSTVLNICQ